jgi:ATP-binding cassette subfamily C exporter for protease/lipase
MYDDPCLLVLDEPNSNLDDVGEQALVSAIAEFRKRGKTVVLITHRSSAIGTTNKLLLLRDGAAQAFGPTSQVLADLAKAMQEQRAKTQGVAADAVLSVSNTTNTAIPVKSQTQPTGQA